MRNRQGSMQGRSRFRPVVSLLEDRRLMSVEVTTFHNDNARTGANLEETTLTLSNVNSDDFGLVSYIATDGKVSAQPLYVPNVEIPNRGTRNVLYVATENDSVYAFDADNAEILWHDGPSGTPTTVLPEGHTAFMAADFPDADISGQLGILATPVIDTTTNTIYVVATSQTKVNGVAEAHHHIVALDSTTGALKARQAIDESITYPGTNPVGDGEKLIFQPEFQKERVALTLVNGVVYTGWTALVFAPPYTGWLIGFNADDLSIASVLNINPTGNPISNSPAGTSGSDFWNSGDGFGVDAEGNLYNTTSNGPFNASEGNWGDSFLKISTANKQTTVVDYFTPFDQQMLADTDMDFGSSGIVVLPDMVDASGNTVQLAISGSKSGSIYVVDRNSMGGHDESGNNNYQFLDNALGAAKANSPAYYNGTMYFGALGKPLTAWKFTDARLSTSPTSSSATSFRYPGTSPSVSANGDTNGIVWAVETSRTQAALRAYDASNLANELYNSQEAINQRDYFGPNYTFITPMIVNGKVYVGTPTGVAVFGLLPTTTTPPTPPPPPTLPPPTPTPPVVIVPASSSPNPLVAGLNMLNAVASDATFGDASLTYTWTTIAAPEAAPAPIFSQNGTNASSLVGVSIQAPGAYAFQVTVTGPAGLATTSSVSVFYNLSTPIVAVPAFTSAPPLRVRKVSSIGVVGADLAYGEPSLIYSWSTLASPARNVTAKFNVQRSNAAKLTQVKFPRAGVYTLRATIRNPLGAVIHSDITVRVGKAAPNRGR